MTFVALNPPYKLKKKEIDKSQLKAKDDFCVPINTMPATSLITSCWLSSSSRIDNSSRERDTKEF